MRLSELDSFARQVAARRDLRPQCATCGKPVEAVEETFTHPFHSVVVVFRCHGKREEIRLDPQSDNPFKDWPRRLFLRNWARYATTTNPERRRVV